jgi:hypothetical protein
MTPRPQTPQPTRPAAPAAANADRGARRRWLERHARARRTGPRARRALAHALRQAADQTKPPSHFRPRRRLLRYRAAAVRLELLEIAALLEHAQNPDPSPVRAVRQLLRDRTSPLYDVAVDVAELRTTLGNVRKALGQRQSATSPQPWDPG